ncbi:conserved hypothetical protein [Alphaproteobacteria bacterium]
MSSTDTRNNILYTEALEPHARNPKGEIAIALQKPLNNQRDLALE